MPKRIFLALFWMLATSVLSLKAQQSSVLVGKTGVAHFTSDAPLELIKASSDRLQAVIEPATGAVAISIRISTFQGFNSAVQREHFLENYLEASKYPVATFSGKIIETIKFDTPGKFDVRAKGILNIHGISTERIIPCTLDVREEKINAQVMFSVPLEEHEITIPKLLSQKIAETIFVKIEIEMQSE